MEITTDDRTEPSAGPSTDDRTVAPAVPFTDDRTEPPAVPSTDDHNQENDIPPAMTTEEVMDYKQETAEEGRNILEVIALTGKFWLEWEKLKSLLSCQLKQVLSAYPEAKMSIEDQKSVLGKTYEELVNRLDEALCSFIEGPPFTLQRLCEILLGARDIYPKLSKLGPALEKNLLVTSTLTMSTDPYPPPITKKSEEVEKVEEPLPHTDKAQNGDGHVTTDKDEVMVDAEATDGDSKNNDEIKVEETSEEKSDSKTPLPMPTSDDAPTATPVESQSVV